MRSGRYQAQQDHSLGYYRVNNHRTENTVVLAQVYNQVRGFFLATMHHNRGNAGVGFAQVETGFAQSRLQSVYNGPQFIFLLGAAVHNFQALKCTYYQRHRQGFGIYLRTYVVFKVHHNIRFAGHPGSCKSKRLGKGTKDDIHPFYGILLFAGSAAFGTQGTYTVGIVYQQAEVILRLKTYDICNTPLFARHTIYTFGNNQNTAARFFGKPFGSLQLFFQAFHIVVLEHKAVTGM